MVLMRDVSAALRGWARAPASDAFTHDATDRLLERMARLHLTAWSEVFGSARPASRPADPWCPLAERLTLLTRRAATGYEADGNPVGAIFLRRVGWVRCPRISAAARDLVDRLDADVRTAHRGPRPASRRRAAWRHQARQCRLGRRERRCPLHRLADDPGRAGRRRAGVGIVTNSAELPIPPDALLDRYHAAVTVADGFGAEIDIRRVIRRPSSATGRRSVTCR